MQKPIEPSPTVEEILNLALSKENQANRFYAKLADQCSIDFVRELLEKLRDEESKHARMITEMQSRLNLGLNPL